MFIGKKQLDGMAKDIRNLGRAVNNQANDLSFLSGTMRKMISTMMLQDKKMINLVEIIRFLVKDKDRDYVIGVTQDGTELSVGDFLDAEDLFPKVEEEFNVATFIKSL